jgi:hypothetical protein
MGDDRENTAAARPLSRNLITMALRFRRRASRDVSLAHPYRSRDSVLGASLLCSHHAHVGSSMTMEGKALPGTEHCGMVVACERQS